MGQRSRSLEEYSTVAAAVAASQQGSGMQQVLRSRVSEYSVSVSQAAVLPAGTDSSANAALQTTDLPCIINPAGEQDLSVSGSGGSKQKLRMTKLRNFFRKIFV